MPKIGELLTNLFKNSAVRRKARMDALGDLFADYATKVDNPAPVYKAMDQAAGFKGIAPKISTSGEDIAKYVPGAIGAAILGGGIMSPEDASAAWQSKLLNALKTAPKIANGEEIRNFLVKRGVSPAEIRIGIGEQGERRPTADLIRRAEEALPKFEDVLLGGNPEHEISMFDPSTHNFPDSTQFDQYQLPGAKEGSYRELFVTSPKHGSKGTIDLYSHEAIGNYLLNKDPELYRHIHDDILGEELGGARFNVAQVGKAYKELIDEGSGIVDILPRSGAMGSPWQDGHSQYSNIQNPIVRLRFNDRLTPDQKKILFLEEMQGPSEANQNIMDKDLQKRLYDIGVKRALDYAKEHGYHGVAWTPGQVQADRYDLSKQVTSIKATPYREGETHRFNIKVDGKDGNPIYTGAILAEDLPNYVGKDLANKIIADKGGDYSGLDLQVGGEGLKNLYDRMLPKMFEKYGKEKVGRLDLGTDSVNPSQVSFIPITSNTPKDYNMFGIGGALAGTGIAGAVLGMPEDASAIMPPDIRQLYNTAREAVLKNQLYHHSPNPRALLNEGIGDFRTMHEDWKPAGLYWTDNPKNIAGHKSNNWGEDQARRSKQDYLKPSIFGQSRLVRGVPSPEAKVFSIDEKELRGLYDQFRSYMFKNTPAAEADNVSPDNLKKLWTEKLRNEYGADILHIKNADRQPGVNEFIQTDPNIMSMFWEELANLPGRGVVESKPVVASWSKGKYNPRVMIKDFQGSPSNKIPGVDYNEKNLPDYNVSVEQMSKWPGSYLRKEKDAYLNAIGSQSMVAEKMNQALGLKEIAKMGIPAGGIAAAVLNTPDEADAFPLGKLVKQTLKQSTATAAMKRSEDAMFNLVGKKLNLTLGDERKPFEVVDVRQGKDDWRYLIVKDEAGNHHQLPMTKDYLHSLTSSVGTAKYLDKFNQSGYQGKKLQTLKSLGIREAKKENGSIQNDNLFREWNAMQKAKVEEIDPSLVHDYAYVKNEQGETLYMPRQYADFLASKGYVTILKR